MATPLDVNGLGTLLAPAFVFIFVFAILYALLNKIKFFGENEGINAVVAFIVGVFVVMAPGAQVVLASFLPSFFLFMIFVFFMVMFFMFLGVKGESIVTVAKDSTFMAFSIIVISVLFLISLSVAYGPFFMVGSAPGFWESTKRLIFSRKVLGLLFMLFIAAYAISFIGQKD